MAAVETLPDDLVAFLRAAALTPFEYGVSDCGTWAAAWIDHRAGQRPADWVACEYSSLLGCMRYIRVNGGLLTIATRAAQFYKLPVIFPCDARPGDVGCLSVPYGKKRMLQVLAIKAGADRWAWRGRDGFVSVSGFPVLRAWRV